MIENRDRFRKYVIIQNILIYYKNKRILILIRDDHKISIKILKIDAQFNFDYPLNKTDIQNIRYFFFLMIFLWVKIRMKLKKTR